MKCQFIAAAAVVVAMIADDPAIDPALAQAQDWPTRPMALVVPFSAGGSSDAIEESRPAAGKIKFPGA